MGSQARILEWLAIPFSSGSSLPKKWGTCVSYVSCIGRWIFYHFTTWEVLGAGNQNILPLFKELKMQQIHKIEKNHTNSQNWKNNTDSFQLKIETTQPQLILAWSIWEVYSACFWRCWDLLVQGFYLSCIFVKNSLCKKALILIVPFYEHHFISIILTLADIPIFY